MQDHHCEVVHSFGLAGMMGFPHTHPAFHAPVCEHTLWRKLLLEDVCAKNSILTVGWRRLDQAHNLFARLRSRVLPLIFAVPILCGSMGPVGVVILVQGCQLFPKTR